MTRQSFAILFAVACVAPLLRAAEAGKILVNAKDGLAVQGYDVVAYFTDSKPVKGRGEFTATYNGATYRFASADHKAAFEKEPAKYAPQYGGYCGYAASRNYLADADATYWSIVDGRLILQNGWIANQYWKRDVPGNVKKADANWPGLIEKNGK